MTDKYLTVWREAEDADRVHGPDEAVNVLRQHFVPRVEGVEPHRIERIVREDGTTDETALYPESVVASLQAQLTEKDAEIARPRKLTQPSWFYHPDEMETCMWSPLEVIDEKYDPAPGKYVFEVECATSLPSIWCAVHCLTDEERDAMDTDDRFIMTEHASEEGARKALGADQ